MFLSHSSRDINFILLFVSSAGKVGFKFQQFELKKVSTATFSRTSNVVYSKYIKNAADSFQAQFAIQLLWQ